jgi:hypothetical protein
MMATIEIILRDDQGNIVNYPAHRAGLQKGIIIFILRESVPQTP